MYLKYLQKFLLWVSPLACKKPKLIESINDAKKAWKQALAEYNHITDRDLLDFAIHNIKATERRYMALIKQAKDEQLSAWPADICSSEIIAASTDKTNDTSRALAG